MSATLPIVCAWCDRVRSAAGRWERTEASPVAEHSTHGICPDCLAEQTRAATGTLEHR